MLPLIPASDIVCNYTFVSLREKGEWVAQAKEGGRLKGCDRK